MNHLIKWGPNDQLNLRRLQTKLLFLLILGTKFRFDDITKIDLSSVKLKQNSIEGYCIKPKQTGKGLPAGKKSITFKCPVESDDRNVVSCWKQYMGITSLFRLDGCKAIFIKRNGKPLLSKSLASWIRVLLKECKIPTQYKPYSIVSAATSYHLNSGIEANELKGNRWKDKATMLKWYDKQLDKEDLLILDKMDAIQLNDNKSQLNPLDPSKAADFYVQPEITDEIIMKYSG